MNAAINAALDRDLDSGLDRDIAPASASVRVALVTADARSFPDRIISMDDGKGSNVTCASPAIKAVSAAAEPRYGI